MIDPVFLIAASVSTVAAIMCVTRRNPVYSAVWLLVCFLSFAVVFIGLGAPFLAAIHVLVYTGAILVLFVFVIMLLNLREDDFGQEHPPAVRAAAAVVSFGLFLLVAVPTVMDPAMREPLPPLPEAHGSVEQVGMALFTTYALPFELVSVLVLVAMFGSMILAKKKLEFAR